MRFAMWTVLLISSVLVGTALASHTHIGVGIYERGDRGVGGLSDPYGRNEYDYGYTRGRISHEDDDYRRGGGRGGGGGGYHRQSSYDRQPSARYDRDRVDRDRYDYRSHDRSYGREGYDRRDSYSRGDRNSFRGNRGHNRGYDRFSSGDRGFDRYDRSDRSDRYGRHDRGDRYDRFVQGADNRRDYNDYNDRRHDQRSYDRESDRHSSYDRSSGYDQRSDRYRPRGYYDDRHPRPGPGSFFGQTRYPSGEGQYDRGYGRPAAGRIDGYEVRKYGWNLGGSRNVLNSGYDHGFAGSYQGGYGSAYYSKPAHYIAGVGSRLYS